MKWLDSSYGENDKKIVDLGDGTDYANCLIMDSEETIIAAGYTLGQGYCNIAMAAFLP